MTFRLPTLLTTAAVAAVAAPAAHAAAPTSIATEQHATNVTAYKDAILWSSYQADGRYKLMVDNAGAIAQASVVTSKTPFDVDLGTSASGQLVAVYSSRGKLYSYDVSAGTSKQVGPAIKGAKLSQPTIFDGRVAFVATKGGRDTLYLGKKAQFSAPSISAPQLSGTHLAFVTTSSHAQTLHQVETLRVQTLSGKSHAVYSARSGGANEADIVGPSFNAGGGQLLWARRNLGSGSGNRYVRLNLSTGKLAYAIGSDKIHSVAWLDDAAGFATATIANPNDDDASAPGDGVIVGTTGTLAFTAKP